MKKTINMLLVGVAMLAMPMAKAENIDVDKVKDAAAHYLKHTTSLERITADQLSLDHTWTNPVSGNPTMYLFTTSGEGWIIMSAESTVDPVVAYSDESTINPDCLGESLQWWLDGYNSIISEMQNLYARVDLGSHPDWDMLLNHKMKGNTKEESIKLIESKWDQGNVKGTDYNMLSPVINDTTCPAGCVATAMAQIMYYYKYPTKASGYINYKPKQYVDRIIVNFADSAILDYSIMPIQVLQYSTPTAQRMEISRLQFYAGVSVKMDYGPSGSGAYSQDVPSAMKNRFKYELGTLSYRMSLGDSVFVQSIRDELMNKHLVYMSGSSTTGSDAHAAGHAWVCGGYRMVNTKMYYMNWGWDGSGNGWYNLGDNNMPISSMGYNFIKGQGAIFGMVPPADSLLAINEAEQSGFQLGRAYPNPASVAVNIPYHTSASADLVIYSVDGRVVRSQRVEAGEGEVSLRVDAMPAGVYIYRLGSGYGKFVVR
ncbi:MAG: thiol protease/hemagglutinin PrtT [Bacteroidales bacterium]|nr:thiol protease/hemagglutinin PrtT [Bacteroidales bacterium]